MARWTVIGYDWHTYAAYRANQGGQDTLISIPLREFIYSLLVTWEKNIVGPWKRAAADTRDIYEISKLLRLLKRVVQFASDEY